jgi:adenylate cyclase
VSDPSAAQSHTFLFADLAGFTALTEAHGDEQAADLALGFWDRVREVLPEAGAEEIKTIGDAMMLRAGSADDAVRLGVCVVHDIGRRHGFPAVRVGLHTGPAVERQGDWFGATVNLAARVAAMASGHEILLTGASREAAGEIAGVELRDRGEQRLKNVGAPVRLWAALPANASEELPVDPVCRMAVRPDRAVGVLIHRGVEYRFCSLECVGRFAADPAAFV